MTITVHSSGSKMILTREGAAPLIHTVPRRNKFFKEELKGFREDIRRWMCGEDCDVLITYKPSQLSFYRRVLYQAVVTATQRVDKLVYLISYEEKAPTVR